VSDTVERMMRPQGLFRNVQLTPGDWEQPQTPAPAPYPQGGQYPQTGGFQQPGPGQYPATGGFQPGGQYPQGGQYPAPTGGFPQAGPPPAWPGAALAPGAAVPPGATLPPGGYPGPYGNGQQPGPPPPGVQYPGGQYQNGPYGPGVQYAPDGTPHGTQYGPDGMPLSPQYGPDGLPAGDGGHGGPGLVGRLRSRMPKGPLIPVVVAAAVVVIVVAALMLATSGGSPSLAPGGGASTASPGASSSASAALNQQQAASALAGLLSQSGTDHSDVNAAVSNVEACKGLTTDAKTFNRAATNRRALLTKLARLPGRTALPAAMLSNLTGAWQASATVDADLAKWAADGAGKCKKNNLKDPNYTATLPFDSKATNDKTAFVKQWNSLAHKYGFPSYSPSQI
jgi:hypothetical protein